MLSMIHSIFQNKLIDDDRSPLFTFIVAEKKLGFYMLEPLFWIQVLVVVGISATLSCAMWAVTYYAIVLPRRGRSSSSVSAYLVGFGIVCPFLAMYPFWVLDFFDVQNKFVRFSFAAIYPTVALFRTFEALFGFTPKGVDESFKHYALYNACVLDIEYAKNKDPKMIDKKVPIKAVMKDHISIIQAFGKQLLLLGVFMSIFSPMSYEPYDTDANGNEAGFQWVHLLDFNLFLNNLVGAYYFQMVLTIFTTALQGLASVLYGVKTHGAMMNPIFEATSASDFWGRRWNLIVHGALKRGVFKPVYKMSSSKGCAVLASFLASGMFHEYLLYHIHAHEANPSPVEISYGKNTAFMMWNAAILVMESLFGGLYIFQWMKKRLPRQLVTCLVLSMALPVAHWFIHPYSKSDFFEHFLVGVPMIKEIHD